MSCPNPELLAAMAEDRLDPGERDSVLDHAAQCDDCRQTLLVLSAPRKPAAVPLRRAGSSWIPWAAAAAFAVSLAALLLWGQREDRSTARAIPTPKAAPQAAEAPNPVLPKPDEAPKRTESPNKVETTPKPVLIPAPRPSERPAVPEAPVKPAVEPPKPPAEPVPAIPPPEAPKPATVTIVAVLDRMEGEVVVTGPQGETPAKAGREIRTGEGLESRGARSWALLSFPDKTRLELSSDTLIRQVTERDGAKGRRLFVEKGAVKAEVSKQPAGQPMVFETPHGEARVLGTILRVQVDADPKKGTRLEVEEGKVELRNAAGRTALVEGGSFAVAAAGLSPMSKRMSKEEVLLGYDFEDGKKPAGVTRGTVERGPDRRLCLSGDAGGTGSSRLFIGEEGGLLVSSGDEVLSFDYWVDAQAASVNLSLWNSTQKQAHEVEVPKLVVAKWTRASLLLSDLGVKEGDQVTNLLLQGTGSAPRKFYVDNVLITRSRTLKPRASESK